MWKGILASTTVSQYRRTGNYFYRANPQQHYDGFPRFSQYQSCRDTQSDSLAREVQNHNSNQISISNIQRHSGKQFLKEPFLAKESPIITPIDNQVSSRKIDTCLPGFGEFDISTIKRRSSAIRPSQIKSYKDLLNELQTDEFKQFIFNEEEIQQIAQSAKKQMEDKEKKKKRKQNRVSFKQTHIIIQDWSNKKINSNSRSNNNQSPININQQNGLKQVRSPTVKQQSVGNSLRQKIQNLKQKQQQQEYVTAQQIIKQQNRDISKQQQQNNFVKNQSQNQAQINTNAQQKHSSNNEERIDRFSSQNQLPAIQQNSQSEKNKNKKETKKQGRKNKKKEKRITQPPSDYQQNQQEIPEQQAQNKKKNLQRKKKQVGKQNKQNKIIKSESMSENTNKQDKRKQNQSKKLKTKSQPNQYLQQLTSQLAEQNSSTKRYPKRIRIKPLQYWQSEKVHYKAGKAMGIQRANLDFKDLLNVAESFDHKINVNFHTHDIEIDLLIPAKKQVHSQGIKQQYQSIQISINSNKHQGDDKILQIYFEDGLRTQKLKKQQSVSCQSLQYFQIINKSKIPVHLVLKLKVKIQ